MAEQRVQTGQDGHPCSGVRQIHACCDELLESRLAPGSDGVAEEVYLVENGDHQIARRRLRVGEGAGVL